MPNEPMPWERQTEESGKAFAAFACYRDMGIGRSISLAAARVGKSVSMRKRWSARYGWQERVAAWDREQDRRASEAAAQAVRERAEEIRQKQLKDGKDLQRLARAGIAQLIDRDAETGEPRLVRELTVSGIVALHRYGAELERLAAQYATGEHEAPAADEPSELAQKLEGLPDEDLNALLEAAHAESARSQRKASRQRRRGSTRNGGKDGKAQEAA
jgi:hypothetical protein